MTQSSLIAGDANVPGLVFNPGNDGTLILQTGPNGAKVTALSIDAAGRVQLPQSVVAFSAWANAATSATGGSVTVVLFGTKEFDTNTAFDVTTGKFQPSVPGYYQIQAEIQFATGNYAVSCALLKNGSVFKYIGNSGVPSVASNGSTLVYLNGTTDYTQIAAFSGTTQNTSTGQTITHVSGFLVAKA